ncbi:MAG: hypothetical protein R3E08_08750 [Thiotrichaceae bacterium]
MTTEQIECPMSSDFLLQHIDLTNKLINYHSNDFSWHHKSLCLLFNGFGVFYYCLCHYWCDKCCPRPLPENQLPQLRFPALARVQQAFTANQVGINGHRLKLLFLLDRLDCLWCSR